MVALATVRNISIVARETGVDETTAKLHKLAAAQGGVAVASVQEEKATLSVDRALDRLRASTDAAYRDQQRFERGQRTLNAALATGRLTSLEYGRQLDLLAAKYRAADAAQDRLATGGGRLRAGLTGAAGAFGVGLGAGYGLGLITLLPRKVTEAVRSLDDLGDAAQRASISGERLQVIRFALEQTTGSAEGADAGMQRFARSVGELAVTGGGPAKDAFDALGISIRGASGELKSQEEIFDEVARRFSRIKNEASANAIATRLFGREAGPALAVLLQDGIAGMDAYERQLRELGGVMSNEAVAAADVMQKRFNELSIQWDSAWKRMVITFLEFETEVGRIEHGILDGLGDFFKKFGGPGMPQIVPPPNAADERIFNVPTDQTRQLELRLELERRVRERNAIDVDLSDEESQEKQIELLGRQQARFRDAMQAVQDRTAALRLDMEVMGKSAYEAARLRTQQELLNAAIASNVDLSPKLRQEIDAVAEADARAVEMTAKRTLAEDLRFQRDQFGRGRIERDVASRLQGAGLEVDLGSAEAGAIRFNLQLERTVGILDDIRGETRGMFSDLFKGLREGDPGAALESFFGRIADKADDALSGVITDALFGQAGTSGEGSPLGGILRGIFGPKGLAPDLGLTTTASMNVQAGIVTIGGAGIGGLGLSRNPFDIMRGEGRAPLGLVTSRDLAPLPPPGLSQSPYDARSAIDYLLGRTDKPESHIRGLNTDFASRLQNMFQERPELSIASGYRSLERQQELWNAALQKYGSPEVARRWVAPPGRSQHNFGNAADLRFGSEASRDWAHANAERFGLKFPLGNEPWHVEMQETRGGEAFSRAITQSGEKITGSLDRLGEGMAESVSTFSPAFTGSLKDLLSTFQQGGGGGGGFGGFLNGMFGGGFYAGPPLPGFGLFADGGISNRPAIFGERGPEAAIPLKNGAVPVTFYGGRESKTEIIINNNVGANVTAKETKSPRGGRRFEVQVDEMVAGALAQGPRSRRALGAGYGATPRIPSLSG